MKFPLVLSVFVVVSGCTPVPYNAPSTKIEAVEYPPLDEALTAQLGDEMVEKGVVYEEKVLFVKEDLDTGAYEIPAQNYSQVGSDEDRDFFSANGVGRAALSEPVEALAVDKHRGRELCVITKLGGSRCYDADFEKRDRLSRSRSSFQKTLIYNGREGDRINLGYREYRTDRSRVAVSDEVAYDLGESRRITYKGAEIEVIEADSHRITYRLLSRFPE